jgi:tetratricopeptide (TPR) repeat protein
VNDSRHIRYFLMQHELNPASKYFLPLSDLYIAADRLDEAADLLVSGLELHPESVPAQLLLGLCRAKQGRPEDATRCFDKVLKADPLNNRIPRPGTDEPVIGTVIEPEVEIPVEVAGAEDIQDFIEADAPVAVEPGPEPVKPPVETMAGSQMPPEPEEDPGDATDREVPAFFLTSTLADIYLAQNHREKALRILYQVLAEHPDRDDIASRITELETALGENPPDKAQDKTADTPIVADSTENRERFDRWLKKEMEGS